MNDLLQKAEELFDCGRYQECRDTLQLASSQSQVLRFSREQWSIQCNMLACQMKDSLRAGGVQALRVLWSKYQSVWDQMRGLPPTTSCMDTELSVVCALHQLQMAICLRGGGRDGRLEDAYEELMTRMKALGTSEEETSHTLPGLLLSKTFGSSAHQTAVKLVYNRVLLLLLAGEQDSIMEILEAIATDLHTTLEEGVAIFDAVLSVGEVVKGDSSEVTYAQAWNLCKTGQYAEALHVLQPLLRASTPSQSHILTHPHITSAARLMAGACYFHMGKPNLALCSYHQCVSSRDSTLAALPAMHSSVSIFRHVDNATAECQTRELLTKALSLKEAECKERADGVLWRTDDEHVSLLPCPVPGLDLPEAMYRSAVRDMRLQRYRKAASSLGELSQSLALPPSLPPLSKLLLLRAQALMCGGEWSEGEEVCTHLMATLQPAANSFLQQEGEREGSRHTLTLAQAQWLKGLAALHRQSHAEAKQCWESCLRLTLSLQVAVQMESDTSHSARQLQILALNNLAVLSVALGELTTGLHQLAEVVVASHPHPSPLTPHYNHCLLLGKTGRMAAAAESWVGCREGEGLTAEEGRERLHDARRRLSSQAPGDRGYQLTAMDIAMWGAWLRHRQKH